MFGIVMLGTTYIIIVRSVQDYYHNRLPLNMPESDCVLAPKLCAARVHSAYG